MSDNSYETMSKSRLHHFLGRARVSDSYSWGRPIYAPVAGKVISAHDGSPDRQQLSLLLLPLHSWSRSTSFGQATVGNLSKTQLCKKDSWCEMFEQAGELERVRRAISVD